MSSVKLAKVDLPEFGLPSVEPQISSEVYARRVAAAQALNQFGTADVSALIVYGDREHFANLAYLTGYDPRFEEALLILVNRRGELDKPMLLVGNEGWGYAEICRIEHERVLYQNFSLPGQPRGQSLSLEAVFRQAGIGEGVTVGVVGWKYFDGRDGDDYLTWLEIPAYIVDTLRNITGDVSRVINVTDKFMSPDTGLRANNEVDQLAAFEFAAAHSSQAVRNVLFGLRVGMTEYEAVQLMRLNGIPLSAHLMLSSGERAAMGLPSPSMRVIQQGDSFTMALGLWGGLNARAGFVVRDSDELPDGVQAYVERLVVPYFAAIVEWYEHVGIGVAGGELYDIIHKHLGDPFFGVGLNPGHLIHLDEWVDSPIYAGSSIPLRSGMAIQVDVIPATHSPYFTTNIEDGIALADEALRREFAEKYPEAWGRILARRQFMEDVLGIRLKPEVLPFSNIPAYLPPYLLNPQMVMTAR